MWTTCCRDFEDFQLIFMNHIRLLIRNQCGSYIIHGIPNPLAFQKNYSRYDGPSESGSFFTLSKPSLTTLKKTGPRTDPCGTPSLGVFSLDSTSHTATASCLSLRYKFTQDNVLGEMPKELVSRFCNRKWSAVSNATLKSKRIRKIHSLSSITRRTSFYCVISSPSRNFCTFPAKRSPMSFTNIVQKRPVTTMLTYPWKCTVLYCNHLGNHWCWWPNTH